MTVINFKTHNTKSKVRPNGGFKFKLHFEASYKSFIHKFKKYQFNNIK